MTSGWTGGQYSVLRALLGAYLCAHFLRLLPWGRELFSREGILPDARLSPLAAAFPNALAYWDAPLAVTVALLAGAALAVLLAIGWWDRAAAIALWYLGACLVGRNPLAGASASAIGWLLLWHACLPGAPFGSVGARGRSDPGGGWRLPPALFAAAWTVLALAFAHDGVAKLLHPAWHDGSAIRAVLEGMLARPTPLRDAVLALPDGVLAAATWTVMGLELAFAPLALLGRARPWIWLGALGVRLGALALVDAGGAGLGLIALHLFALDPAWIRPRRAPAPAAEWLFYDGHCGLCHRAVRFALAEDRAGALRFAPLGGAVFVRDLPAAARAGLPDSLVLRRGDGQVLVRSEAVLYLAERLGGLWRVLALVARAVPSRVRDGLYDAVARARHRLFARPAEACPIVPAELRGRIES